MTAASGAGSGAGRAPGVPADRRPTAGAGRLGGARRALRGDGGRRAAAAPFTAAPIFVGLRLATAESNRLVDFTLLCGVFMSAGIASWIGFQRDEKLHGA